MYLNLSESALDLHFLNGIYICKHYSIIALFHFPLFWHYFYIYHYLYWCYKPIMHCYSYWFTIYPNTVLLPVTPILLVLANIFSICCKFICDKPKITLHISIFLQLILNNLYKKWENVLLCCFIKLQNYLYQHSLSVHVNSN